MKIRDLVKLNPYTCQSIRLACVLQWLLLFLPACHSETFTFTIDASETIDTHPSLRDGVYWHTEGLTTERGNELFLLLQDGQYRFLKIKGEGNSSESYNQNEPYIEMSGKYSIYVIEKGIHAGVLVLHMPDNRAKMIALLDFGESGWVVDQGGFQMLAIMYSNERDLSSRELSEEFSYLGSSDIGFLMSRSQDQIIKPLHDLVDKSGYLPMAERKAYLERHDE